MKWSLSFTYATQVLIMAERVINVQIYIKEWKKKDA